jgi:hypothetical protein
MIVRINCERVGFGLLGMEDKPRGIKSAITPGIAGDRR